MAENEIQFRKRREIAEIFSDSFEFIKQEYKTVFRLISTYVLPFIIVNAFLQVHVQRNILEKIDIRDTEALMANFGPVYMHFFLASLFTIFVQSLFVGAYYTYLEAYIKEGKDNFSLSDVTPQLFSNSLQAIKAGFVLFLLVLAGFFLCILPGIYFGNTFSILIVVYLFEKNNLGQSMQRSFRLVNVQWWNTFLINLTGVAIIYLSGILLSIPNMLTGELTESGSMPGAVAAGYSVSYWTWTGIASVITSLLWVILYTFLAFQYFNLDERLKSLFPRQQNQQ